MKCVRVATASIQVTDDRSLAEKSADLEVIGTHAAQKAAKFAKEGDYEKAQMEARAAKRFMSRNVDSSAGEQKKLVSLWSHNVEALDSELRNERKKEKAVHFKDNTVVDKSTRQASRASSSDSASVAISKSKQINSKKLFM